MARGLVRSRREAATQKIAQACHAFLAKETVKAAIVPVADHPILEKPVDLLNSRRGLKMSVNTRELRQPHGKRDSISAQLPRHPSPDSGKVRGKKLDTPVTLRAITEE